MAITAAMVKELRELTGAGMLECKNAITEADGNMERAVELLREKGLAAASKKSGRIAAEGISFAHINGDKSVGVLLEVNSETDFVAKNQEFRTFVEQVAAQVVVSSAADAEALLQETWLADGQYTVQEALNQKIATIGENLSIRRFAKYERSANGRLISYIHGEGRISVLMELACDADAEPIYEAGRNLCMQIAALNPLFIDRTEISADFIAKEREVLKQQALNEGKPEAIVEKMIEGRLNKNLKELCLIDQQYVKDGEVTVAQYLENVGKEVGAPVSIARFTRFETGEGIEKKEDNFAEEVKNLSS